MENFIKDIEIVNYLCKNRALLSNIVCPFVIFMHKYNDENSITNLIYDWYTEFKNDHISIENIENYIYINIGRMYTYNVHSKLNIQREDFIKLINSISYDLLCATKTENITYIFENINYFEQDKLQKHKLINSIIKVSFMKFFVFSNELFDILNKKNYISQLLFNAGKKYKNVNTIAHVTFDIFKEYKNLPDNFPKSIYIEFLTIYALAFKHTIQLNSDDLSLAKLDKNKMIRRILNNELYKKYDLCKMIEFLEFERYSNSESLEDFICGILEIPQLIKKIMINKTKNDLLGNQISKIHIYTLTEIDKMKGVEFEQVVSNIFFKMGYNTKTTKITNDQGIDIIATRGEEKIAIQVKRYSGIVGNHAIMEAVAGMNYYQANKCMVITNNYFSKSAIKLAKVNNVILWDRNILEKKLY